MMTLKLIVTLILFAIAAAMIGVGLLKHRKSHWIYGVARVVSVILSALLAVFIANLISGWLGKLLAGNLTFGVLKELTEKVPSLKDAMGVLVASVIAPMLFLGIFAILRPILDAVAKPVSRKLITVVAERRAKAEVTVEPSAEEEACPPTEECSAEESVEVLEGEVEAAAEEPVEPKPSRKERRKQKKAQLRTGKANPWGMLCGAVCGLLLFVIYFTPAVGMVSLLDGAMSVLTSAEEETQERSVMGVLAEVADAGANNPASKTVTYLGGYPLYSGLTTYRMGETLVNMNREARFLVTMTSALTSMTDEAANPEAVAKKLRRTGKEFGKTDLLPTVLPELCRAASEDWSQNQPFCGLKKPSFGRTLSLFTEPLFDIFAESNDETIKEDIATLCDVLATVVEADAMERMKQNPIKLFEDQAFSASMVEDLLENPRMNKMVGGFMQFGINTLGNSMHAYENKTELHQAWLEEMQQATIDALMAAETHEEAHEDLTEAYRQVLDGYGLRLDPSAASAYAAAVIAEHDRVGNLDLDVLDDLLTLTAVQNAEGQRICLTAEVMAEQSVVVLLNGVKLDGAVTDPAEESKAIAKVLADMADVLTGKELTVTDSLGGIGLVLDDLAATQLVGPDRTARILTGLFQTGQMCDTLGCTLWEVTDIAQTVVEQAEKQSYRNMMSAIGHTIAALQAAGDDSIPMRERIEGVLETMSPETAVVLQKLSLPSVMVANGVPGEVAGDSAQFMSDLFGDFATMSGAMTAEQIHAEAGAMTYVTTMAMHAGQTSSRPTFGADGTLGVSAAEYVDQMLASRVVKVTMMSTVYPDSAEQPEENPMNARKDLSEAETEELLNALNTRYAEEKNPTDPDVQRTYVAIGAMVNLPVAVTPDGITAA